MNKLRVSALTATLAASLALSGCITLLPKTKPAQLYRFGAAQGAAVEGAAAPTAAAGPQTGLLVSVGFTRVAEGDRILTATGSQTAYIAQSRWVAPASTLFEEAAVRAFETSGAPFRLMQRGDIGASNLALRIDVETFETDYPADGKGAPTIVVRANAQFVRPGHGATTAQSFVSTQPAGENRVGAIVSAYDAATADVLKQIVSWTTVQAAGG